MPVQIAGQDLTDEYLNEQIGTSIEKYLSKSKCREKEFVKEVMIHQSLLIKDTFVLQMAVFAAKIILKKYVNEENLPECSDVFLNEYDKRLDYYEDSPPLDELIGTAWLDVVKDLKLKSQQIGDSDAFEFLSRLHKEMSVRFTKVNKLMCLDEQVKRIVSRKSQ